MKKVLFVILLLLLGFNFYRIAVGADGIDFRGFTNAVSSINTVDIPAFIMEYGSSTLTYPDIPIIGELFRFFAFLGDVVVFISLGIYNVIQFVVSLLRILVIG